MPPAPLARSLLFGWLSLAPLLACADADTAQDGLVLPAMPTAAPAMRGVRKLSDSELGCAQIHAEATALEHSGQAQAAEARQAQDAMAAAQNQMMKEAGELRGGGGIGSAIGGGLLGLIPGAGQVQGYAMQAAASARQARLEETTQTMVQAQARLMNAEQALEHARARGDHLADLFLRKGCRLSQLPGPR